MINNGDRDTTEKKAEFEDSKECGEGYLGIYGGFWSFCFAIIGLCVSSANFFDLEMSSISGISLFVFKTTWCRFPCAKTYNCAQNNEYYIWNLIRSEIWQTQLTMGSWPHSKCSTSTGAGFFNDTTSHFGKTLQAKWKKTQRPFISYGRACFPIIDNPGLSEPYFLLGPLCECKVFPYSKHHKRGGGHSMATQHLE